MNCQLSMSTETSPVVGVRNDTTNNWVARVNDLYTAPMEATDLHISNTYSNGSFG
ncbi:hypothetical protein PFY10_19540 [Chryseobacterium daecheongense]|nr:hypothetical protein PFY10_19540 [Chryseobacterium daecheongense]